VIFVKMYIVYNIWYVIYEIYLNFTFFIKKRRLKMKNFQKRKDLTIRRLPMGGFPKEQ